jgi:uncharacterized protein involved in exopolysaccharide biosynthesis
VLQTLVPNEPYRPNEIAFNGDPGSGPNFGYYLDIFRRRIFYFLLPFGLISIVGLYVAALLKPDYLSEGKILVETQRIAPELVRPIATSTANERIQLIQQRILTRDNLLAIASKFRLFPERSAVADVLDLMRENTQIKAVDVEGQLRQGASALAFTVGFQYEKPELAMQVANDLIKLIVDEDARSRTSRASDAAAILTGEANDIAEKLESTQKQILEVQRRPADTLPEVSERQKSQLTSLGALKAELIQKLSVYSDAHPAVTALKKRIAAMEKSIIQVSETGRSTQTDDLEALKRQKDALERRLTETNNKLSLTRLSEKLDRDQQSERLQIIESPSLPQKPLKSNRIKLIGIAFALAATFGVGTAFAAELLDGTIRSRLQLSGVVDNNLLVTLPYMSTRSDAVRVGLRKIFVALTIALILTALGGLAAAIIFHVPLDFSWLQRTGISFGGTGQ